MPKIRTIFRPWEELDVSDEEAAMHARQGMLAPDPDPVEPEPETPPEPTPAPATKPRRGKTDTTTAPAEEVNTDGSSEEGAGQAPEG